MASATARVLGSQQEYRPRTLRPRRGSRIRPRAHRRVRPRTYGVYGRLRKNKERAAKTANTPDASSKGGKASGGERNTDSSQGATKAQQAAAGRKGAKKGG